MRDTPVTSILVGVVVFGVAGGLLAPTLAAAQDADGVSHDGAVRFVAAEGDTLQLDGGTRYLDTLELPTSGATVVNELGFESYVAGIAEMPARWPMEALKAQAVAARTYAWWVARRDTYDGYDICATTACQVFRGAEVVRDDGQRWQEAVDATAGEVLTDTDGAPVLARYFSTSGGRTYANEDVFPASGEFEHLIAIDDPDDAVSPYHRWQVRFTREEFDTLLARGDTLGAAVPVERVERLGPVEQHDAELAVIGTDGTRVEVDALAFRDFVSRFAPDLDASRFPPTRSDGLRPLPTTVPSTRFAVTVDTDEVVIDGQGWGHGVGMGQYGAQGRAARGEPYDAILASYYNGLMPRVAEDLPERIRVGIEASSALTIGGDGPFRIEADDGTVLVERALGPWTATRDQGTWQLDPPEGTGAELQVGDTREAGALGTSLTFEAQVNKPVELTLEVRDAGDEVVVARSLGVVEAGSHTASWSRQDAEGRAVEPGTYRVALVAEDAVGARAGQPVEIEVTDRSASDEPTAAPNDEDTGPAIPIVLVVTLALAGLLLSLLLTSMTRKDET